MDSQFFKIKVSVIQACWQDCTQNGVFLSGKTFFRKDQFTGKFIGMYQLPDDSPLWSFDSLNQSIKVYQMQELRILLQNQLLYKISERPHDFEESFSCIIKTPTTVDDFLITPNYVKENMMYWIMNLNQVTGPYFTKPDESVDRFVKMHQNNNLLVLSRRQTFESNNRAAS